MCIRDRYGPGHNSFTKSEDGTEDLMIYHCRNYTEIKGDPLFDPNRQMCIRDSYNSVSVLQREVVFRKDKAGIKKLATDAATLCKELEGEAEGIDLYYEYSPESFTGTEPEYAVEAVSYTHL